MRKTCIMVLPNGGGHSRGSPLEHSIVVIGLTGAGKSTIGRWISELLGWKFIDLDAELEADLGLNCPDIVRCFGWAEFREREALTLERLMGTNPYNHVVSCGGGVIETERARLLLKEWRAMGIVLLVRRDIGEQVSDLKKDGARMIQEQNIQELFDRRMPWLEECSNRCYHNSRVDPGHGEIPAELRHFIATIHPGRKDGDPV